MKEDQTGGKMKDQSSTQYPMCVSVDSIELASPESETGLGNSSLKCH